MADKIGVNNTVEDSRLSSGMRVIVRGQEWLVTKVQSTRYQNHAVTCVGISPLVRDMQVTFLDDLDEIVPSDPTKTRFVPDDSPRALRSHLYIESLLRSTAPTDAKIHIGNKAAMDQLPYQLVPAKQALSQPRQRILIADAVGLGKTLEAGILMAELIKRHKGRRILVVTAKSMMAQFQKEMWDRFTIPLVSLDSSRIQKIRSEIPANANPFSYYDKVIVSIDTLKRDIEYGAALEASHWDIIVIDEAQNVADRGTGTAKAQRARLAERLASRSDTLIMLSATPHDGRARSFASLMNMLDPTTLPDPNNYNKDDIRQLYVRRFKKDVIDEVKGSFPERRVTEERCIASEAEENAFDCLTGMTLHMDERRHSNSGLFTTLLEKSLFSSPAACIKTIDERIKRITKRESGDTSDVYALKELRQYLTHIGPEQFSRYVRLRDLLRSPSYGWTGKDTEDRVVIFTERIETKKFLEEQLRKDLKLPKKAIVSIDGQMSDLDQQDIVAKFGDPTSPIRVLVASDVASEGLNLHYLCHRLIHFDTPWSLMVFQQRNGRIDRYGQRHQPDIRFMEIQSRNEKIKGDTRILEILREKEDQARRNIGDPSLLMGVFDIEGEEAITRHAIESGTTAEDFDAQLAVPAEDIDKQDDTALPTQSAGTNDDSAGDGVEFNAASFIARLMNADAQSGDTESSEDDGSSVSGFKANGIASDASLMSDFAYVKEGLGCPEFQQSAGITSVEDLREAQGFSVTFAKDSSLRTWLRRHVPDVSILGGDTAQWSTDWKYCERRGSGINAQINGERWNRVQYLWALNPLAEWVGLKATSMLYERGTVPIIGSAEGRLNIDDTIVLMTGVIANERAVPVIDTWFGIRYTNGEYVGVLDLDEVWKLTGYRGHVIPGSGERQYVNREQDIATAEQIHTAESLLVDAVERGRNELATLRERYETKADVEIDEQLKRIGAWRKHRSEIGSSASKTEINAIYQEYENWVNQSLTATGEPVIRVVAAFTGSAAQ